MNDLRASFHIRPLHSGEPPPYALLLEADPWPESVEIYLPHSEVVVTEHRGQIVGVCATQRTGDIAEIRNIAVSAECRGLGLGRRLLDDACIRARSAGIRTLRIATGNSSIGQLSLYQKAGFDIVDIRYNHFTEHYPEPIVENGIVCRHQIILEKDLVPGPSDAR